MHKRNVRGMTLIELMITISLLAIVIAIGLPSFTGAINGSRLSSAANELSSALQVARAEAVRRNRSVVLCRSDDQLTCSTGAQWIGWLVFVDLDANGAVDPGEDIIKSGRIEGPLVMRASAGISGRSHMVAYLPNGLARGASEAALLSAALSVCAPSTQPPENVRDVLIAFGGRTMVRSRGTAGDCSSAPNDN